MWRLSWRNLIASSETPGKTGSAASALAFTGSSVHFFDQSERTITTEPSGHRPCFFSHARMSDTLSAYVGLVLTCLTIEMTTSGRTANVAGSSSMLGYSGAQWAG